MLCALSFLRSPEQDDVLSMKLEILKDKQQGYQWRCFGVVETISPLKGYFTMGSLG